MRKKPPSSQDAWDEVNDVSKKLMQDAIDRMKESNLQLSKKQKRFIEYFWSRKKLKWREEIPLNVLLFLINEDETPNYTIDEVYVQFSEMDYKGYVKVKGYTLGASKAQNNFASVQLEKKGLDYIKDQHPTLIVLIDRLFSKIPFIVKLIVGLIGLVASILGIIDFVTKSKPS